MIEVCFCVLSLTCIWCPVDGQSCPSIGLSHIPIAQDVKESTIHGKVYSFIYFSFCDGYCCVLQLNQKLQLRIEPTLVTFTFANSSILMCLILYLHYATFSLLWTPYNEVLFIISRVINCVL